MFWFLVPVNVPDFQLLLSLTECLAKEGLTLDYTLICTDNQNFQLEKQLEKLIYSHKFEIAHSFSTIAGLPHGPILTVEVILISFNSFFFIHLSVGTTLKISCASVHG